MADKLHAEFNANAFALAYGAQTTTDVRAEVGVRADAPLRSRPAC